jgi:hypothetical protein
MPFRISGRRWLRFNLRAILFLSLCVCGYFGFQQIGIRAGEKQRHDESYFIKTYPLGDVLAEAPTDEARGKLLKEASQFLKQQIPSDNWEAAIDYEQHGEISPLTISGCLVIAQSGAIHDRIDKALRQFRQDRLKERDDKAVATLNRLLRQANDYTTVLVEYPLKEPLAAVAVDSRYEGLVQRLNSDYGTPQFSGKCIERGFPSWSAAQSLTSWKRSGGVLFVAVQDWPEKGRVVVDGWRPNG